MYCSSCGVEMPENFRFCSQCGASAIDGRPHAPSSPLRRSQVNKKIAGVCGGLAEHLGIDPTLVRLIMVCAAFWGFGIALYILCWFVMPSQPPVLNVPISRPRQASVRM
jgi:phage shock protein PspC (stress-responsive transcriptional regulator)